MPELPEVETTRRGIEPHIKKHTVTGVTVREPRLRWPVTPLLGNKLIGQRVLSVVRMAKYLLIQLQEGYLLVHLGMSGSLRIVNADTALRKHDHVEIVFDNGAILRYHDPRRFGCVLWISDIKGHPLLDSLGVEPLGDEFSGDYLYERSRNRKGPVKNFIMDGHIVVGVGNIYANESLFLAGIHPNRAAGRVSRLRYQGLAEQIRIVLARAIEAGGSTLRDFVNSDGNPGYFAQSLNVYGRAGLPCVRCREPLSESRLGQRATVYCKTCQR